MQTARTEVAAGHDGEQLMIGAEDHTQRPIADLDVRARRRQSLADRRENAAVGLDADRQSAGEPEAGGGKTRHDQRTPEQEGPSMRDLHALIS